MKTLIDEPLEDKKIIDSIDETLSGYTTMIVDENDNEVNAESNNDSPPENNENWKGDHRYFQTGKKAGQLRPSAKKLNTEITATLDTESTTTFKGSNIMSGIMLLVLVDSILPLAISFINNKYSKRKVKSTSLKMTKTQKNELQPIADEVVKLLNVEANPIFMLSISMIGIYGLNLAEARNE